MKDYIGTPQKIQADMMTPSNPRTLHLIKANVRRNMPKDVLSKKNLQSRRKPLNINSPSSR